MWRRQILEQLSLVYLEELLAQAVSQGKNEHQGAKRDDFDERLWVLKLREIHPNPRQLDRQVAELIDMKDESPLPAEFIAIWKQLPHRLVEQHWSMVRKAAATYFQAYPNADQAFSDLISAGQEALFLTANRYFFNPKGTFKNAAWNALRAKIKEDQQHGHPVPFKVRQKLAQLEDVRAEWRRQGQTLSRETLKAELDLHDQQLEELLEVASLWGKGLEFERPDDLEELDTLDLSPSALALMIEREERTLIEQAVEGLSERSQLIITGLYFENHSLRSLAEELGVSLNSLKKAHKTALHELRQRLAVR
jgi:RNA polymerase sigma factor (sigma-70 family)